MSVFYNENNPHAAEWLRNLIAEGHLANGVVESKSIVDVQAFDIPIGESCHFFAGIGGWPLALDLAGWPSKREVWTGSCPCQPFSGAGQGRGFADERHLWPEWFRLIGKHRPRTIFGEQVEGPAGRAWLDLVFADLEGAGYACGAVVFPAAGVGAPHGRHRTYWVADTEKRKHESPNTGSGGAGGGAQGLAQRFEPGGSSDGLAHDGDPRRQGRLSGRPDQGRQNLARHAGRDGATGGLADTARFRRAVSSRTADTIAGPEANERGARRVESGGATGWPSPVNGFWRAADWLYCRDNKWRPVEPGTFPLAHGAPARVGRLRAYGNAICIPQAVEFIKAFMET